MSEIELDVTAIAHGGAGIARDESGRVVFIDGAVPGDTVRARLTKTKKRWARASLVDVLSPSPSRVPHTCPAAAAGAGCCDYSHIAAGDQLEFKKHVLIGQLRALAGRSSVFGAAGVPEDVDAIALEPVVGWRTRVRLGVDGSGRAGLRHARSNDLVTQVACTQAVPGLLDGVVGTRARTFNPGSEVVAVRDADGQRHVVETAQAPRGKRVERAVTVLEGTGTVTERVGAHAYTFPATAFWQAHTRAPDTYAAIVEEWGAGEYERRAGWDLYGGVGVFVPAIDRALGGASHIDSVDISASAAGRDQACFEKYPLSVHNMAVEEARSLVDPGLVVLDPPRTGAGEGVVRMIAAARPQRVIHIGCDPATFARDLATFGERGYAVTRLMLIDAFPNTHHFEVVAALEPAGGA
ncbi:class I SAM-dependent RNA methyltransferase [Corynebacterium liangguodongii]|uniref:RNA methyltransferase n=1 Tax=Corynebacterium liangguodongii TaxID=2079535 RepID=A0A2S0WEE6_9CORY|nr:TRAM domain-containing protein [Corynebacterium liangguodongii]AWB84141.1 RNA methyltransferase [Corynebacterium liangguodongii]PWC00152.1 class I SAM-dependent RNA methyltransferase [Corynebacterium liangguodongii]